MHIRFATIYPTLCILYRLAISSAEEFLGTVPECPSTEKEWKIRKFQITCDEGKSLVYHCLLDLSGQSTEICLQRRIYIEGCPWVLVVGENAYLGVPATPCENKKICPNGTTPFFSDELYKYPVCLVKEEQRANYSLPDKTVDEDGGKIRGTNVGVISVAAIISLIAGISIVIGVMFYRRKQNRRQLEEQRENELSAISLIPNSITQIPPSDLNENDECEDIYNSDFDEEVASEDGYHQSDEEEFRLEDINSWTGLITTTNEDGVMINEKPLVDQCCEYAMLGLDLALEKRFKDEADRLNKGCTSNLSACVVKRIICVWLRFNDKPDILTAAVNLLSNFDKEYCLDTLELVPMKYSEPISVLLYAGKMRKEKTVSYLLKRLRCIDETDKEEKTILHYCVLLDSEMLAKEVIEKNESLLDKRNIDGCTAFNIALTQGKLRIAEFLLGKGANIQDENFDYRTIFEECFRHQWKTFFKIILSDMKSKNSCSLELGKLFRALFASCRENDDHLNEIALGIFPEMLSNKNYFFGNFPLIWSMKLKLKAASHFILKRINNTELCIAEDNNGFSALHTGISHRFLVKEILERDQNHVLLNIKDRNNNTPIMYAAKCNRLGYLSLLLRQPGIDLVSTNSLGQNIMHLIVEKNWYSKCAKILKGKDSIGAKLLNEKTKKGLLKGQDELGLTPLMQVVKEFRSIRILQLLIEEGSELLQKDKEWRTVFHHLTVKYDDSIETDWKEWAYLLVNAKHNRALDGIHVLSSKDLHGQSPLEIATQKGCLKLLEAIDYEIGLKLNLPSDETIKGEA